MGFANSFRDGADLLAAAVTSAAATAVVVVVVIAAASAAAAAVVAAAVAAAAEQDDQENDPPPVIAGKGTTQAVIVAAHRNTSDLKSESAFLLLIPWYSPGDFLCAGAEKRSSLRRDCSSISLRSMCKKAEAYITYRRAPC